MSVRSPYFGTIIATLSSAPLPGAAPIANAEPLRYTLHKKTTVPTAQRLSVTSREELRGSRTSEDPRGRKAYVYIYIYMCFFWASNLSAVCSRSRAIYKNLRLARAPGRATMSTAPRPRAAGPRRPLQSPARLAFLFQFQCQRAAVSRLRAVTLPVQFRCSRILAGRAERHQPGGWRVGSRRGSSRSRRPCRLSCSLLSATRWIRLVATAGPPEGQVRCLRAAAAPRLLHRKTGGVQQRR